MTNTTDSRALVSAAPVALERVIAGLAPATRPRFPGPAVHVQEKRTHGPSGPGSDGLRPHRAGRSRPLASRTDPASTSGPWATKDPTGF